MPLTPEQRDEYLAECLAMLNRLTATMSGAEKGQAALERREIMGTPYIRMDFGPVTPEKAPDVVLPLRSEHEYSSDAAKLPHALADALENFVVREYDLCYIAYELKNEVAGLKDKLAAAETELTGRGLDRWQLDAVETDLALALENFREAKARLVNADGQPAPACKPTPTEPFAEFAEKIITRMAGRAFDVNSPVRIRTSREAEAESLLLDLLAVIHRDGGHHTAKVGLRQSVDDARATFLRLLTADELDGMVPLPAGADHSTILRAIMADMEDLKKLGNDPEFTGEDTEFDRGADWVCNRILKLIRKAGAEKVLSEKTPIISDKTDTALKQIREYIETSSYGVLNEFSRGMDHACVTIAKILKEAGL